MTERGDRTARARQRDRTFVVIVLLALIIGAVICAAAALFLPATIVPDPPVRRRPSTTVPTATPLSYRTAAPVLDARAEAARVAVVHAGEVAAARAEAEAAAEAARAEADAQAQRGRLWDAVARCETGGDWSMTGSTFSGGVGFANTTWTAYGGGVFAPLAGQATREQQIVVAERVYQDNGGRLAGAWGCDETALAGP